MFIMKRDRKSLSLLLGLVLMLQGVTSLAAPCLMSHDAEPVAMSMAMDTDMPCHGEQEDTTLAAAEAGISCCDVDCPNMSGCMLGQLAIHAGFQLATEHASGVLPAMATSRLLSQPPPALLRPPIFRHG